MSFFKTLFDFSFSEYVTTKIIRFLYVVTIIIAALVWIGVLISSFAVKPFSALIVIAAVIFCPIGFVLQVIFTRVGYEIMIVLFGIAEHTRDMAWALTGGRKAPPTTPPAPQAQPQYPAYPPQSPTPQAPQYPQYPQAPQPPQQPPAAQQYPQYPQYPQPPQPGK